MQAANCSELSPGTRMSAASPAMCFEFFAEPLTLASGEAPPLSVGELSILFDEQLNPGGSRYNVGRVYRVGGVVEAERFASAVRDVAQLHVPLRWTFGSTRRRLSRDEAVEVDIRVTPVGDDVVEASLHDAHRTFSAG